MIYNCWDKDPNNQLKACLVNSKKLANYTLVEYEIDKIWIQTAQSTQRGGVWHYQAKI